jgi:hypothetical protein
MESNNVNEMFRERMKENPVFQKYLQQIRDDFRRSWERKIAIKKAVVPSADYLEKRSTIIGNMLKKLGVVEEIVELSKLQEGEIERVTNDINDILSDSEEES